MVIQELGGVNSQYVDWDFICKLKFAEVETNLKDLEAAIRELEGIVDRLSLGLMKLREPHSLRKEFVTQCFGFIASADNNVTTIRRSLNGLVGDHLRLTQDLTELNDKQTKIKNILETGPHNALLPDVAPSTYYRSSTRAGKAGTLVLVVTSESNYGVSELLGTGELKSWGWERRDEGAEVEAREETVPTPLVAVLCVPTDLDQAYDELRGYLCPRGHVRNLAKVAIILPTTRPQPDAANNHRTALILYSDGIAAACAMEKARRAGKPFRRASLDRVKPLSVVLNILSVYGYERPAVPAPDAVLNMAGPIKMEKVLGLGASVRRVGVGVCLATKEKFGAIEGLQVELKEILDDTKRHAECVREEHAVVKKKLSLGGGKEAAHVKKEQPQVKKEPRWQ